jgi:hypothetical protein
MFSTTRTAPHLGLPRTIKVKIEWKQAGAFARRRCHYGHAIKPHTRYALVWRGPESRVLCESCAKKEG